MDLPEYFNRVDSTSLQPCPDDAARAEQLLSGLLMVRGHEFSLPGTLDWAQACEDAKPGELSTLHALEWLDVLRRIAPDRASAEAHLWTQLVATWSLHSKDSSSGPPWFARTLARRCRVLAAGMPFVEGLPWVDAMMRKHVVVARTWLRNVGASFVWDEMLDSVEVLWRAGGVSDDLMADLIGDWATGKVGDDGWVLSADLVDMETERQKVRARLDRLHQAGVDTTDVTARLASRGYLAHMVDPSGSWVQFGSRTLPEGVGGEDPRVRYSQTHGGHGHPPEQLVASSLGLVTFRSGFGENERLCEEETLATVVVGPWAGSGGHADGGRVTYASDGVQWLIDPLGHDLTAADEHSRLTVRGQAFRGHGGSACIIDQQTGDQLSAVTLRDTYHRPLRHERTVLWSALGEFLVVVDSTAGQDHEAVQSWVIHPDVHVDLQPDASADGAVTAWLTCGEQRAAIHGLGITGGARVESRDGAIILTLRGSGGNVRLVTWVGRVTDLEKHRVELVGAAGSTTLLKVCDHHYATGVAFKSRRGALVAPTASPQDAAQALRVGPASAEEIRAARLDAWQLIEQVKDEVWRYGGGEPARREAIVRLKSFARDRSLLGGIDHGVGAALVDLAGDDLAALLESGSPRSVTKRVASINWTGALMHHPTYKLPLWTTRTPSVPEATGKYIHSVDLGSLNLVGHVVADRGETLVASFHGSLDRTKVTLPYMSLVRWLKRLPQGPRLVFSDPTLDLDASMRLSWFLGNEHVNVIDVLAELIIEHAQRSGAGKIITAGISGGGFAALQVAARIPGATAIVSNPQTVLRDYKEVVAAKAGAAGFGDREALWRDGAERARFDAVQAFADIGFSRKVVYVQNVADEHHVENHFQPFMAACEAAGALGNVRTIEPDLGPGHRSLSPKEWIELIASEF